MGLVTLNEIGRYQSAYDFVNLNSEVQSWLNRKHGLDWKTLRDTEEADEVLMEMFDGDIHMIGAYFFDLEGNYNVYATEDFDTEYVIEEVE